MGTDGRYSGIGDEVADDVLVAGIRSDQDEASEALIRRHHLSLVRLARLYATDDTTAAELAQATWLAALTGIERFEGHDSFRSWLFRILVDRARDRDGDEPRPIPFASTTRIVDDPYHGAVDPERLRPTSDPVAPLHWAAVPSPWSSGPAPGDIDGDLCGVVEAAVEDLSPAQREVVTLRDILGWESDETGAALGISDASQRILLHRARSTIRTQLEEYLTS